MTSEPLQDPTVPVEVKLPVRAKAGHVSLSCWRGDCSSCPGAGGDVVRNQVVVATAWTCGHRCHKGESS